MNISEQAIRDVCEILLVSNTPLYLYKHLRRLQTVQTMAKETPEHEIASEFARRVSLPKRRMGDVAVAYACLVALTYKPQSVALETLASLDLSRLDWASTIRNVFFARARSESLQDIHIKPPQIPLFQLRTEATTTSDRPSRERPQHD